MIAPYPKADREWLQVDVGAMETVIETIRAVRNVRADLNLPPAAAVELFVFGAGADRLAPHESYLTPASPVSRRSPTEMAATALKGAATMLVGGLELAIPLRGLVDDPAAEIERNRKQLHKVDQEIRFVASKLANPQFLERAAGGDHREGAASANEKLMDRRAALERNVERLSSL